MNQSQCQLLLIMFLISSPALRVVTDADNSYFAPHIIRSGCPSSRPILIDSLYNKIKVITVKILYESEFIGSGVIIYSQNNNYKVITNAHVLKDNHFSYSIQTFDGKIHISEVVKTANLARNDLALLQFKSPCFYVASRLGSSANLKRGQYVLAAGFPFYLQPQFTYPANESIQQKETRESAQSLNDEFDFTPGKIVAFLEKPLEGGYQIGYNGDFEKGMSGGPLLNQKGELVGISGRHPVLWENSDNYEDGSQPSPDLQTLINNSSWAIPSEQIIKVISDK